MLKILVCDNNREFCDFISDLVVNHLRDKSILYEIYVIDNPLDSVILTMSFDLCFLDIDMSYSGIDLACDIKRKNERSVIVFISAKTNLVFNSFSAHPYDFIPKTLEVSHINKRIEHIISKFIPIWYIYCYKGIEKKIDLSQIYLFEKFNNNLSIETQLKTYTQRKKLSTALIELNSLCNHFVQANKSCIVNLSKISDIKDNTFILTNGRQIPLTKKYIMNAKRKFLDFI